MTDEEAKTLLDQAAGEMFEIIPSHFDAREAQRFPPLLRRWSCVYPLMSKNRLQFAKCSNDMPPQIDSMMADKYPSIILVLRVNDQVSNPNDPSFTSVCDRIYLCSTLTTKTSMECMSVS